MQPVRFLPWQTSTQQQKNYQLLFHSVNIVLSEGCIDFELFFKNRPIICLATQCIRTLTLLSLWLLPLHGPQNPPPLAAQMAAQVAVETAISQKSRCE